jgi:hypothetical protein
VACERAYPAPPAFAVRVVSAIALVRDGMAEFIHQNSALRLTFAKITYLRDTSCNINGTAIWEYVAGSHRVKTALYVGWRNNAPTITHVEGEPEADFEAEDETEVLGGSIENQQIYCVSFEERNR